LPNTKGLALVVSKGRLRPRVASAEAITREVTRQRRERQQYLREALRAIIGSSRTTTADPALPRPTPLQMPTVFADVDIEHGELPVVSWPTYKRRVRAYLERIARRR
jgi:hypothetical protein